MYKDIIFSFIPIVTMMIIMVIAQNMNIKCTQYVTHSINKKINLNTGNRKIDAYFISLGIIVFVNLIYSIFGLTNFICYKHNSIFFYLFSIQHTILCFIYGLYKKGPLQIFSNFYYPIGNGFVSCLLASAIALLQIFMNVFVNTMVIPTRIVINYMIGHEIHNAMAILSYGFIIICVINFVKILLYTIQSYIFIMMSHKLYKYLCD